MILKATPTNEDHLRNFSPKEKGLDVFSYLSKSLEYPEIRPMMSFSDKDKIVFICGLSFISEGVWEAWLIPSDIITKYKKSVVRTMKDFIEWVFNFMPVHRIQIAVLEENKKWAQSIGFSFESLAKMYHNKKDHYIYTKVNHGS